MQHGIPDKELIEFSLFLPKGRAFSKVELDPIQPLSFYEIKDKVNFSIILKFLINFIFIFFIFFNYFFSIIFLLFSLNYYC